VNDADDDALRVPYLTAAVMAVEETPLIATMLRRAAELYAARAKVAIVAFPFKLDPERFLMGWHPRMDAEPAHLWFRELIAAAFRASQVPIESPHSRCSTRSGCPPRWPKRR
jgi:DNA-binding transcriptional LysR family regulator